MYNICFDEYGYVSEDYDDSGLYCPHLFHSDTGSFSYTQYWVIASLVASAWLKPSHNIQEDKLCNCLAQSFTCVRCQHLNPKFVILHWPTQTCRSDTAWSICKFPCPRTTKCSIYDAPNRQTQMFLVSSCSCFCPIQWSQVLNRGWRCSRSSADRRCSNYIWVIDNFIAY